MVEDTLQLIANASELPENLIVIASDRSKVIQFVTVMAQNMLTAAARTGYEFPVSMLEFSYGNLKLSKSVS